MLGGYVRVIARPADGKLCEPTHSAGRVYQISNAKVSELERARINRPTTQVESSKPSRTFET